MYPSDATSMITITRKKSFAGALLAYKVKINGDDFPQRLMIEDTVPISLPPGQYELRITAGMQGSRALTFVIQAGQQIDFTCEGAVLGMVHPITLYRNDDPPPQNVSQKLNRLFAQPGQQQSAQQQQWQGQPQAPGQFQPQPQPQAPSAGPAGAGMWAMPGNEQQSGPAPRSYGQAPGQGRNPQGPGQNPQAQSQNQGQSPARPQTGPVPEPEILEYVETDQTEEPLGQEVRVIDNRQSGTGVTRSVKASREWTRNLTVGTEKTRTLGAEVGGKWHSWLALKGTIESELQRNYSMETGTKHLFEESITISAPPRTTIRLVLHWKRIWQNGVVRLSHYDGSITEVPYKFVVNITFDQSQQDTDSDPTQTA